MKVEYFIQIETANIHQMIMKIYYCHLKLIIHTARKIILLIMQVWRASMPYKKKK